MQPGTIIPAPNLFPSANVVYVDNDYLKLRGKGLLAYRTLEDAVISWRAGGAAVNKYGTPSTTNRGAILVGVGTIECLSVTSDCVIDVDFLNIIGQGKDVTILTSSAVSVGNMVQFNVGNCVLKDLTIKAPVNASRALIQAGPTFNGNWDNIKVTGNPISVLTQFNPALEGRITNCVFDGSAISTAINTFTLGGTCLAGGFFGCLFTATSSQPIILSLGADFQGVIRDCEFRGPVTTAVVSSTGGSGGFGGFFNCYFESESAASSFSGTSAFSGFSFTHCSFLSEGKVISIKSNERTKFVDCSILALVGNNHSIELLTTSTFFNISNCRVLGSGTGLAISSVDAINAIITNCALKTPTGDTPGSSVSSNITNIALGGGSSNEEIPNSQQY